jgi:hypothetical protein
MTFIGLDCGVNTGVAVWDSFERKLTTFKTDFWGCVDYINKLTASKEVFKVIIENPALNKPTFRKKGAYGMAVYNKISQNVGSVKRESTLLIEYFERNKIHYEQVCPMTHKWSHDYYKSITGLTKRVSQHERDASKYVWGLTNKNN